MRTEKEIEIENIRCIIIERKKGAEADLLQIETQYGQQISAIQYPDGEIFSPCDWEGEQAEDWGQIRQIDWQTNGRRGIIFNGLPRLFL